MNMNFLRKLPIPQDIKAQFPISDEMVTLKVKRDEEIKRYSKTHNVLFIAFSPDFEYIVVKRQDVEFCERL